MQLLSRTAIELVVERQGREETREHNIDADDPQRRGHAPTLRHSLSGVPALLCATCRRVLRALRALRVLRNAEQ